MNRYTRSRLATVALATVAGLALAGCGTSAATSGAASSTTAPGHAATSSATTGSGGSGGVVSAASLPFPVAVGNTWVYDSSVPSTGSTSTVTNKILSVVP